jgi:very-short-patch-repair endonuclease
MAAVLAYAPKGVLSHHSAAVLWGVCPAPFSGIHVTVLTDSGVHGREGVHAHRCRNLDPADATRRDGIPVTSPGRTLLDLATQDTRRVLARAVEEAQIRRVVTDHSLNVQFQRYPKHRGTAALRKAIRPEPALTRSEAERRFLELIRRAGLPEPRANVRVGRYEVDFYWPENDLIVEIDGYAFHSSRGAFERDRRKDGELGAQGHRVMRITWRRLVDESEALVANLAVATASGRAGRGTSRRGGGRAAAA